MSFGAPNMQIVELDRVEIAVEPWSWEFATARRKEIERNFAARRREQPALWNGRILLLHRYAISDGVMRGACFETDYASFLAWRDWDFPDAGVFNVFASAALQASDGAYLVGEMAPHTANAGAVYFPCGTPDPEDVSGDGALDLAGSVSRELLEETGLDIGTLQIATGWSLVRDRCFLALMKRLTARQSAKELRDRTMRHLASEAQPEFSDIRIVRGHADLDPRMPRFLIAFLEEAWRQGALPAQRPG
jgi:8-oxo-dGTP pyrophosphatase MutT (NUDIX family)